MDIKTVEEKLENAEGVDAVDAYCRRLAGQTIHLGVAACGLVGATGIYTGVCARDLKTLKEGLMFMEFSVLYGAVALFQNYWRRRD